MAKQFSVQSFDAKHYQKTEAYAAAVQALFDAATRDIMQMKQVGTFDPNKPFKWSDYPSAQAELDKITTQLATKVVATIEKGSRDEWLAATKKSDAYIGSIMDTSKLSKERLSQMQDKRLEALSTFQGRKVEGLDLSQRVWKYVDQYKGNLEDAIDLGLGNGTAATTLSRDVRQYLQDPDVFFRRYRVKIGEDENGRTIYGRKWKRMYKNPDGSVRWIDEDPTSMHTGRGVYRSSYKNAMRLTRSEINMAYRESDWERWQQLEFVVGFEVHRSNHRPEFKCPLCERLSGRYPKNFKFVGWHPQCRCYVTPVIMDDDTFDKNELSDLKAAMKGKKQPAHKQAKNAVTEMPEAFTKWAAETAEKVKNGDMTMKSVPYFIRDNFVGGDITKGVKPEVERYEPILTKAAAQAIVENAAKQAKKEPSFESLLKKYERKIQKLKDEYWTWRWDNREGTIGLIEDGIEQKDILKVQQGIEAAQKEADKWNAWDKSMLKDIKEALQAAKSKKLSNSDVDMLQKWSDDWSYTFGGDKRMSEFKLRNAINNVLSQSGALQSVIEKKIEKTFVKIEDCKSSAELKDLMMSQNKYVSELTLDGIELTAQKALCQAIVRTCETWGLERFDVRIASSKVFSRSALMHANGGKVEINKKYFGSRKVAQDNFNEQKGYAENYVSNKEKKLKSLQSTKQYYEDAIKDAEKKLKQCDSSNTYLVNFYKKQIKDYKKQLKKTEESITETQKCIDNKCQRWTIEDFDSLENYMRSTIQHELGHTVHYQTLLMQKNKFIGSISYSLQQEWHSLYQKYNPNGMSWLSEYGMTNDREFFAECTVLYMERSAAGMPDDVKAFFDKLLKAAQSAK